jgi:23S rRNA (adenine2030-N6)-methyltransferase
MNYRHAYHAGSYTDVVKHVILTGLIASLAKKAAPFCYIDTHAGTGFYDLLSNAAKKTQEFVGGIEKVIQCANPPALIKQYLDCVHLINNRLSGSASYSSLRYYPGSPLIARTLARDKERLIACELHLEDYQALRTAFINDKRVAVHHMDGYLGLKAFLPPAEHRGLILIDPPYEDPDEFTRIAHTLPTALKRFETGIYAIWYPIKENQQVERFYRTLTDLIHKPILAIELTIYPDLPNHLNGCGMAIINPPWQFDTTIMETLPWLWKALTINNQGAYSAHLLKNC